MKRWISLICTMALLFTLLPAVPVAAASVSLPWDGTVDISWYDPDKTEYEIGTPAQLAGLAALVNGMTDPQCPNVIGNRDYLHVDKYDDVTLVGAGGGNVSDSVYVSKVDFAYKTVRLTADLDMGGIYNQSKGSWSGPNWTPIGGKFPMIPEEVKGDCFVLDTRFNGVLDGQGHTVKNIYCNRYAAKGFPYSMAVGLVGYLGGASDLNPNMTGTFQNNWIPAVKNIVVGEGYLYGRRMVGGVVGRIGTTNYGVVIENCANFADIKNTDSKGVGGICGTGWGDGVIRNCLNAGTVTTTYACPAGGICGSNGGMDICYCFNTGKINTNGAQMGRGIGGHDSGSYTVTNSYYLSGSDDDIKSNGYYKGSSTRASVDVTKLSEQEMKSSDFLALLNQSGLVFVSDSNHQNNGFPVLWYQVNSDEKSYTVSIQDSTGGTVEADKKKASTGEVVTFTAVPAAGYILDYYLVNGERIPTNFYTVTEDLTVSAVWKRVRSVSVEIPKSQIYYLSVLRTGYKLEQGTMVWVTGEKIGNGEQVLEGNQLKLLAHGYSDISPEDMSLEYTDGFTFSVGHCDKNADGTYTATGDGEITIAVERGTRPKSFDSIVDTSWYDSNSGSKTFQLTSGEQLAGLSYLVNTKGLTFQDAKISLGNSIILNNSDGTSGNRAWTAIGVSLSKSFRGTFDGQGYGIYGMNAWNDGSYAGLFGCCIGATIENLKVSGHSDGEASAAYAAGIAAYASGCTISGCSAYVNVAAGGTHVGGIAAEISDGTLIENCFHYGEVSGVSGVGGIVGVSSSGTDQIVGCGNFGSVISSGSDTYGTGGIAGKLAGTMESCVNRGNISSTDRYTGGLAGYTTTRHSSTIILSQNQGAVSSSSKVETAGLGGLVGYGQYLKIGGSENKGAVKAGGGFLSVYKDVQIGRVGDVSEIEVEGSIPSYQEIKLATIEPTKIGGFTVTFEAQGAVVETITCKSGTKKVSEPLIPEREGYTSFWNRYELDDYDVTVKAIYRQNLVPENGEIKTSGIYYVPWFSSGEIHIDSGLNVVLCGENGESSGFDNLSIVVGSGTNLTLENLKLSGEKTLLRLEGKNTLVLSGRNGMSGRSDAKGNQNPTILMNGDVTISGTGSLKINACANNAAVFVNAGSTITQESGAIYMNKSDLLGLAGGAFYANGSSVVIKGGKLYGHTNSDNVAVLSADQIIIQGGTLNLKAEKSPYVLMATKTLVTGGSVQAWGHSGNSATVQQLYRNENAISNLVKKGGTFQSGLPFTDVFPEDEFYDAVAYCYQKNYFTGISATGFSPESSMTRAMFASVLYRMAGAPGVTGTVSFTDLNQSWYQNAIAWAVNAGITSGTSDTTFSPNLPVTREQAAVFLYRYAMMQGRTDTSSSFEIQVSEAVSGWSETQVEWALQNDIFEWDSETMESPKESASRELLALALQRYDALN